MSDILLFMPRISWRVRTNKRSGMLPLFSGTNYKLSTY
ncbi:hypothetical protein CHCC20375_0607 [Bacillus licheniformis]|nr:hypothetical protein CHCC20375_0607 [Bacillus licheniformis]